MKKKIVALALAALAAGGFLLFDRAPDAAAPATGDSTIEQSAPAALAVTTAAPARSVWPVEVEASGWTAAWQEIVISAEVGGERIEAMSADVGDVVHKGDLLVQLSRASLLNTISQLEAAVASAQAELDLAEADADRARKLGGSGSAALSAQSADEYFATERKARAELAAAQAELASARLDLDQTRIHAIEGGVISSRSGTIGDVVAEGAELYRLIRDGRMEWQAEVPLRHLMQIAVDTPVAIPTPLGEITGTVRRIAPTASVSNGRVKVYVSLTEPENGPDPKTGVMISGRFLIGESEALHVPSSAVVLLDGFSYVFVLDADDPTVVRRERVETGRRRDDQIELLGDFAVDAQVVQSGGAFLSDGSRVRLVDATADAAEIAK